MKTTILLTVSALIFLFISPSLSSRTAPENDVIHDSDGNPLQIGDAYRLYGPSTGGYVSLTSRIETNETYVIQYGKFSLLPGLPFTFSPVAIPIGENSVKLGTPLIIQSPVGNEAGTDERLIWNVSTSEGIPVPVITTSGEFDARNGCLRIVSLTFPTFPTTYSFEHCPNLCGAAGPKICYPVGVYPNDDEGYNYLSIRGTQQLRVMFVKDTLIKMV